MMPDPGKLWVVTDLDALPDLGPGQVVTHRTDLHPPIVREMVEEQGRLAAEAMRKAIAEMEAEDA